MSSLRLALKLSMVEAPAGSALPKADEHEESFNLLEKAVHKRKRKLSSIGDDQQTSSADTEPSSKKASTLADFVRKGRVSADGCSASASDVSSIDGGLANAKNGKKGDRSSTSSTEAKNPKKKNKNTKSSSTVSSVNGDNDVEEELEVAKINGKMAIDTSSNLEKVRSIISDEKRINEKKEKSSRNAETGEKVKNVEKIVVKSDIAISSKNHVDGKQREITVGTDESRAKTVKSAIPETAPSSSASKEIHRKIEISVNAVSEIAQATEVTKVETLKIVNDKENDEKKRETKTEKNADSVSTKVIDENAKEDKITEDKVKHDKKREKEKENKVEVVTKKVIRIKDDDNTTIYNNNKDEVKSTGSKENKSIPENIVNKTTPTQKIPQVSTREQPSVNLKSASKDDEILRTECTTKTVYVDTKKTIEEIVLVPVEPTSEITDDNIVEPIVKEMETSERSTISVECDVNEQITTSESATTEIVPFISEVKELTVDKNTEITMEICTDISSEGEEKNAVKLVVVDKAKEVSVGILTEAKKTDSDVVLKVEVEEENVSKKTEKKEDEIVVHDDSRKEKKLNHGIDEKSDTSNVSKMEDGIEDIDNASNIDKKIEEKASVMSTKSNDHVIKMDVETENGNESDEDDRLHKKRKIVSGPHSSDMQSSLLSKQSENKKASRDETDDEDSRLSRHNLNRTTSATVKPKPPVSTRKNGGKDGDDDDEIDGEKDKEREKEKEKEKERFERDSNRDKEKDKEKDKDRDRDRDREKEVVASGNKGVGRGNGRRSQLQTAQNAAQWVACDLCSKWRKIPSFVNMEELPEQWFCFLNHWDLKRRSCSAPEENNIENTPEKADPENTETQNERTGESMYGRGRGRGRGRFHNRRGGYNGRGERSIERNERNEKNEESDEKSSEAKDDDKYDSKDKERDRDKDNDEILGKFRRSQLSGVKKVSRSNLQNGIAPNEKEKEKEDRRDSKDKDKEKEKESVQKDEINWVECSKCSKWRKVPGAIKVDDLPEFWYCALNTWAPTYARCGAREETEPAIEDVDNSAENVRGGRSSTSSSENSSEDNLEPKGSTVRLTRGQYSNSNNLNSVSLNGSTSNTGDSAAAGKTVKKVTQWVQCERLNCKKWRKLPAHVDMATLSEKWYCEMNRWDTERNQCGRAEESDSEGEQQTNSAARSQLILANSKGPSALSYRRIIFGTDGRVRPQYSEKNKNGFGIFSHSETHRQGEEEGDEYVEPTRRISYWGSSAYDSSNTKIALTCASVGAIETPAQIAAKAKNIEESEKEKEKENERARNENKINIEKPKNDENSNNSWSKCFSSSLFSHLSNSFQSNNFDYLSGKVSSANIVGNRNNNDSVNKINAASNLLNNNLSLQYAINATQHSLHFPSNFPLKKLPKRLLLAQNLTEFEKQNIECSIVSLCLSSSPAKFLTLSKLMKSIKSSYFNDVRIDSVKCHLIDNIDEVKIALKRLQSTGSVDVSICNATENTGGCVEVCVTLVGELLNINESFPDESGLEERSGKLGKMKKNARTVMTN